MPSLFPSRSLVFSAMLIALVISFSPRADAQIRRRVRIRTAAIALQPFTVGPRLVPSGRPSSFAYYSPRSIYASRHTAIDSDDDQTNTVSAPVQSSGSHPTVGGSRAVLRNGVAYAPAGAPDRVKSAIWAVNNIRHKPYVWGGGHGSFDDRGYDCSGTVSYALHHAGLLSAPLPSSDLMRYGERGRGRWITVYARNGHTFAMIAGLRLDTTDFRYGGDVGPRWHTDSRSTGGFVATHPVGL